MMGRPTFPLLKTRSRAAVPVDKSKLRMAEPERVRDAHYAAWLRLRPSIISGRKPRGGCECHHVKHLTLRAKSARSSDLFMIPLTEAEHRSAERHTSREGEIAFFAKHGIADIAAECRQLRAAYRLWQRKREEII